MWYMYELTDNEEREKIWIPTVIESIVPGILITTIIEYKPSLLSFRISLLHFFNVPFNA